MFVAFIALGSRTAVFGFDPLRPLGEHVRWDEPVFEALWQIDESGPLLHLLRGGPGCFAQYA